MTTKEPIDALVIRHLRGHEPIRIVCAWCRAVLVDVPEDERGTSHGMCRACEEAWWLQRRDPRR
jgi:hypothetical protein